MKKEDVPQVLAEDFGYICYLKGKFVFGENFIVNPTPEKVFMEYSGRKEIVPTGMSVLFSDSHPLVDLWVLEQAIKIRLRADELYRQAED